MDSGQQPGAAGGRIGPREQAFSPAEARRKLRNGLISLALLLALVVGLLLAIPGLRGLDRELASMEPTWLVAAAAFEVLSCLSYVLVFLKVFEPAPVRVGARIALTELAFNSAVSLGGLGSIAIGAWLMIERGAPRAHVIERSAVLFLLTSAVNLVTLVLLGLGLATGLLPGPERVALAILPVAAGLVVLAFFLVLPNFAERSAGRRPDTRLGRSLVGLANSVRDTKRYLRTPDWRLLGAVGYLWLDIAVLVACFAALGDAPPLAAIVLAYQIGYVADFVPIPGGIGVLDGSLIGMLVLYGVDLTTATAATLAYRTIALWIPALWGTAAFMALQRDRKRSLAGHGMVDR